MRKVLLLLFVFSRCAVPVKQAAVTSSPASAITVDTVFVRLADTQVIYRFIDTGHSYSDKRIVVYPQPGESSVLTERAPLKIIIDTSLVQAPLINTGNNLQDSLFKALTTAVIASQNAFGLEKKSFVNLAEKIAAQQNKKGFEWKDVFTILAFVTSIIAIWFTLRSQRRDKTYKDLAFLSEVDKMLIANPELWAFYNTDAPKYLNIAVLKIRDAEGKKIRVNDHEVLLEKDYEIPLSDVRTVEVTDAMNFTVLYKDLSGHGKGVSASPEEAKLEDKLRAFCYFKLNNFELALARNHSRKAQEAWDDYMVHSLLNSDRFYKVVRKEKDDLVYNEDFRNRLSEFLILTDAVVSRIQEIERKQEQERTLTETRVLAYRNRNHANRFSGDYYTNLAAFTAFIKPIVVETRMQIINDYQGIRKLRKKIAYRFSNLFQVR